MAKSGKSSPSILNWMGTLILYAIPGVNLISMILFAIFAKSTSKRRFAIAAIILMVIVFVLIIAVFAIFPDFMADLASTLRNSAQPVILDPTPSPSI